MNILDEFRSLISEAAEYAGPLDDSANNARIWRTIEEAERSLKLFDEDRKLLAPLLMEIAYGEYDEVWSLGISPEVRDAVHRLWEALR